MTSDGASSLRCGPWISLILEISSSSRLVTWAGSSPSSHPSDQISHSRSLSKPLCFRSARISLVSFPSYRPYSHSRISSVTSISGFFPAVPSLLLNRISNVFWARVRGLTKAFTSCLGSMSFPGPKTTCAVAVTCSSPFAVSGMSVFPVYWPERDHSVWPVPYQHVIGRSR
jgi:hypothetical protein